MSRRTPHRARAEILEVSKIDCWLVVDDPWRRIIRTEKLPAGTDLMRRFLVELLDYHDKGWRLHDFSTFAAHFFASKEGELKHYVQITSADPTAPSSTTVGLGGAPSAGVR
jgi:hypothetical protein